MFGSLVNAYLTVTVKRAAKDTVYAFKLLKIFLSEWEMLSVPLLESNIANQLLQFEVERQENDPLDPWLLLQNLVPKQFIQKNEEVK